MRYLATLLSSLLFLALPACGGDDDDGDTGSQADAGGGGAPDAGGSSPDAGGGEADAQGAEDLDMQASDFSCIKDGTKVRQFFITNPLGRLDDSIAIANSESGGSYPVGTVIQLIPQEAMVKRAEGWNPDTNDWEFFLLGVSGDETTINQRGGREVSNGVGGCYDCHADAEPQWDLVCEDDHGCQALPIDDILIEMLQDADTRCD